MLTRIEFDHFRGFRKLALDGLQRVNLIVGKNNSGKTSLLEGLTLLLDPVGASQQFHELRQADSQVGLFGDGRYPSWAIHDESPDRTAHLSGLWSGANRGIVLREEEHEPEIVYAQDSNAPDPLQPYTTATKPLKVVRSCTVPTQHKNLDGLIESLGHAVSLQGGEELLEGALQAVDPRIKKIRISPGTSELQIVVDIGLSRGLLPLSQLGQGIYRLVEMFSEIIGASAEVAFIDEIENGIHHTCLEDVWTGLANASRNFGVQIFASTHSYECIEAAHTAFTNQPSYDFGVIQLFRESGKIQGRVLDQEHIDAAIAGEIDLRD